MRTPTERKEAARQFLKDHVGSGQRARVLAFYDDDQDKIIPQHGRRGRKTVHLKLKWEELKYSTILSSRLVDDAEKEFSFDNWTNGVGTRPVRSPLAPLVVVDTSVMTRAIGTNQLKDCRMIIDLVTDGKIRPCVIDPLVKEYRVVIGRGRLPDGVLFDEQSRQLLDEFLARCLVLSGRPENLPATIKADPSDNILLIAQALAQERWGKPCAIVARDNHVLKLPYAPELDILHPAAYLAKLAAAFPQSLFALNF